MKKVLLLIFITVIFAGCGIQKIEDRVSPEFIDGIKRISTKDYFLVEDDGSKIDLSNYVGKEAFCVSLNLSPNRVNFNKFSGNFGNIDLLSNENTNFDKSIINSKYIEHPTHLYLQEFNNFFKNKNLSKNATEIKYAENKDYHVGDKLNIFYEKNINIDTTILDFMAECKYVGENCIIWFNNNTNIKDLEKKYNFNNLGNKFDYLLKLHSELTSTNYLESKNPNLISFPNDYKLNIVLYDINSNKHANDVVGYFAPVDYFSNQIYSGSNEGKFIFLDSLFEDGMLSTFIHEYTHLKTFEQKQLLNNLVYDTWYTEMISMLAQELFENFIVNNNNQNKIVYDRIAQSFYTTRFGHFSWYNLDSEYVSASYANHYLFGTYLVHNYGGLDFYKHIINNKYVNIESIDDALKNRNSSTFDAFIKFPQILVNCDNSNKEFYSLNKDTNSIFSNNNEIKVFNAINLKNIFAKIESEMEGYEYKFNKIEKCQEEGEVYYKIYGPSILKNNYFYEYYEPFGYSVSYIGKIKEGDHLEITQPKEKDFVTLLMFTNSTTE